MKDIFMNNKNKSDFRETTTGNSANIRQTLIYMREYGTNSLTIYNDCCRWFDWDINQSYNFGRQGVPLYAKSASVEGYSPWFISHSNLTSTKVGNWSNEFVDDYIYEAWDIADERMWNDKTTRIVFAKIGTKYLFYGIYDFEEIQHKENGKYIRVYKRSHKIYPV